MPADADFIMKNTVNCHGFYGASSMERLPVEVAIRDQTRAFKQISRSAATEKPARKAGKGSK
jgi:predicted TIM-barrel enzyme